MLKNKCLRKILMAIMSAIILVNFIMPNYAVAQEYQILTGEQKKEVDLGRTKISNFAEGIDSENREADEDGGMIFTPVSKFLVSCADAIMAALQTTFMGDERKSGIISGKEIQYEGEGIPVGLKIYRIRYSPAVIFSGTVPLLDINFFNPMGTEGQTEFHKTVLKCNPIGSMTFNSCKQNPEYGLPKNATLQSHRRTIGMGETLLAALSVILLGKAIEAGADGDLGTRITKITGRSVTGVVVAGEGEITAEGIHTTTNREFSLTTPIAVGSLFGLAGLSFGLGLSLYLSENHYYYLVWDCYDDVSDTTKTYLFYAESSKWEEWKSRDERNDEQGKLYELTEEIGETYEKTSTAYTLRPTISKWYNALRIFSLIGLLSVLVYIGIRIIIISSAQEKSKYKKMLIDWVTAVAILFILHYIMVFIINITQSITKIFIPETISSGGTDKFITNIRNMITGNNGDSYFIYFSYVLMYLALVLLTITFTFQYLKRLVFIAFLTMIAPLIALTYPLDRVKDGHAQAFTTWLREYIFNCLLQPMHLLLYTMLIGTANSIVTRYPLYAIVVLAFFTPAEKFIRKMFGFEKASTLGPLGAATGGALIMSMLNKIRVKPPKDNNGSSSGSNSGGNSDSAKPVRTVTKNDKTEVEKDTTSNGINKNVKNVKTYSTNANGRSDSINANGRDKYLSRTSRPYSTKNGFNAVKNRYITGPDAIKSHKKRFHKAMGVVGGVATGFATGTVAIAANMADGDLFDNTGKAIGEIGATAGVGYVAGKNTVGNIQHGISHSREVLESFQKGTYGEETSDNKIKTAIQEGITEDEYNAYAKAGIKDIKKISELKKKGYTPSQVAERYKLAQNAPKTLKEFKAKIVGKNINGKIVTDKDAERIFKELEDFF